MSKPIDKAQAIFASKGVRLMLQDLRAMQELFVEIDPEDWDDVVRLMEGVALVVNDPSYQGDIEPIE